MSLTRIYVACGGGDPGFNGIYERDDASADTIFYQTAGYAKIVSTSTDWELTHNYGNPPLILYNLSKTVNSSLPINTASWAIIDGPSPTIRTYEFVTGNAQISIVITEASSAVNGTYIWTNSIYVGGGVGTVSGYYKGSGANLIVIYWTTNIWKILDYVGTILYGGDEVTSFANAPPVSNYNGTEEYWTPYGDLIENPISRALVICENIFPTDITLSVSSIAENAGANAVVGTLYTTSEYVGNMVYTYSLINGTGDTDNNSFNISGNQLRATASFDYETKSSYSVLIRTINSFGHGLNKIFMITVTDVNETTTPETFEIINNKPCIRKSNNQYYINFRNNKAYIFFNDTT